MHDETHISSITTEWTILNIALQTDQRIAKIAKQRLIERYADAVHRYASVVLRDQNLAEDVRQDFAVKVLSGDFRHASPSNGRFRDYLKVALRHLIHKHQAIQTRLPSPYPENFVGPSIDDPPMAEQEQQDRDFWRTEFINRAWARLEAQERHRDRDIPYDTLLKYRYRHKPSSADTAAYFSKTLGRTVTVGQIRNARHEAREFLKTALIDEVSRTLAVPTMENVRLELFDLGLHRWLDEHVRKRNGANAG